MAIYIYLGILFIMSIITLITYKIDKTRAIKKQWRIKEAVLLSLAVCGGSIGAIIGMHFLRHKVRKPRFLIINYTSLILHIAIAVLLIICL